MRKLELKFMSEDDKTVTYSLEKPIEPVDPEAVKAAMEEIINQNVFDTTGGDLVSIKQARLVDHEVTEIDLD